MLTAPSTSSVQAGFAAASKLRLNITTEFKTGDQLMGTSLLQRFIMNPYGLTRLAWGILGVVLIMWDLVVIPLTVFTLGPWERFVDAMSVVTFCYWALDLPGTFLVGVDVDGTLEMRPMPIAQAYLRSWFFPDLTILIIDIVLFIMTAMAVDSGAQALQTASLAGGEWPNKCATCQSFLQFRKLDQPQLIASLRSLQEKVDKDLVIAKERHLVP
eukprot:g3517.t1